MTGDVARRITGISTPLFGILWADPGASQADRVRGFLVELEDRRVLYNPMWLEVPQQVDHSLHEIRRACTAALQDFSADDFAVVPIRAIRAACRRFHDDSNMDFQHFDRRDYGQHDPGAGFFVALGALRATIGQQVAMLAAHYDLEIEGDLATVLPSDEAGDIEG
jgi:hypothetical protein